MSLKAIFIHQKCNPYKILIYRAFIIQEKRLIYLEYMLLFFFLVKQFPYSDL